MVAFPEEPTVWELWLYGFAIYSAIGLVWYWFRFHQLERLAQAGDAGAVARFNALLQGFPNAIYAKMLGKRPLEAS